MDIQSDITGERYMREVNLMQTNRIPGCKADLPGLGILYLTWRKPLSPFGSLSIIRHVASAWTKFADERDCNMLLACWILVTRSTWSTISGWKLEILTWLFLPCILVLFDFYIHISQVEHFHLYSPFCQLYVCHFVYFWLLFFSHPVMFNSLWPHRLQSTRPPCPSSSPKASPSSWPLH